MFWNDPDNDRVDTRFSLFEIIFIALECQVIAGNPFFQDVGTIAERFAVAIPGRESLRCITIVLGVNVEVFPTKLCLITCIDRIVVNNKGKVIHLFYAVCVIDPIYPDAHFRVGDGIPSKDQVVYCDLFSIGPEDILAQFPGYIHGPGIFVKYHPAIFKSWDIYS